MLWDRINDSLSMIWLSVGSEARGVFPIGGWMFFFVLHYSQHFQVEVRKVCSPGSELSELTPVWV